MIRQDTRQIRDRDIRRSASNRIKSRVIRRKDRDIRKPFDSRNEVGGGEGADETGETGCLGGGARGRGDVEDGVDYVDGSAGEIEVLFSLLTFPKVREFGKNDLQQ
jgi:hypothetical protein